MKQKHKENRQMLKKIMNFGWIFILAAFILQPMMAHAATADIVQLDSKYTYDKMMKDIIDLQAAYPSLITSSSAGSTVLGRTIPLVILGNQNSPHKIMVQATVHAREYMCTQMVMKMIEYYATNKSDILNSTCFYIVPMANPDGVSIVQFGSNAAGSSVSTKDFIKSAGHTESWKSNAMGVDLNRNFDIDWAAIDQGVYSPSYELYKGMSPASENETKALMTVASMNTYDAFISYHMCGNIIYYDEPGNTKENSTAALSLANKFAGINGYKLHNLKADISSSGKVVQGGFNDWVQIAFNKPGITVEIGKSLPPSAQKSMTTIYKQNRDTWASICE